jgi:hypothetical protein
MSSSSNSRDASPSHRETGWRWFAAAVAVLFVLACFLLLLPEGAGIMRGRETPGWFRSANNLKQIALAFGSYHEAFGHLPPAVITDKGGKPLYSWRVALLPFLEQDHLYKQLKLDEPWDSPHNKSLLGKMPRFYDSSWAGTDPPGLTRYQVFVGPDTAFERPGLTWADFPDGKANTLLVVEAGEPAPWTKPVDLNYDPEQPLPALGGVFTKEVGFSPFRRRVSGFVACFADTSTHFVRHDTDESTLRGFITRNGGEKVDVDRLK